MIKRGNVPVIKCRLAGRRLIERYATKRTVTGGWPWACGAVALLIAGSFAAGCAKQQAAAPPRAAVPVVVAKVTQKAMPVQVTAIGNVEPYSTISIRAQVAGELLEVHFQEGDSVRKGQLLLTIDPRPYEAALAQAQAQLARDKAVERSSRGAALPATFGRRHRSTRASGTIAKQRGGRRVRCDGR